VRIIEYTARTTEQLHVAQMSIGRERNNLDFFDDSSRDFTASLSFAMWVVSMDEYLCETGHEM